MSSQLSTQDVADVISYWSTMDEDAPDWYYDTWVLGERKDPLRLWNADSDEHLDQTVPCLKTLVSARKLLVKEYEQGLGRLHSDSNTTVFRRKALTHIDQLIAMASSQESRRSVATIAQRRTWTGVTARRANSR